MLASSNIPNRALESVRPGDGLSRCEREQAEILATWNLPAWLTTMTFEDWEREKELLLVGRSQFDGSDSPRRPKHLKEASPDALGTISEGRGGV